MPARMNICRIALVLVALAGATPSRAQEAAAPLRAGDLIRLRHHGEILTGTVASLDESVHVMTGNGTVAVPLSADLRIERSLGSRSRPAGMARGAGIGLLCGALGGAVIGFSLGDDPPGWFSFTAEEKALATGAVLGVGGLAVGGIIGLVVPGHRWENAPLEGVQARVYPTEGGVGIAIQLPTR